MDSSRALLRTTPSFTSRLPVSTEAAAAARTTTLNIKDPAATNPLTTLPSTTGITTSTSTNSLSSATSTSSIMSNTTSPANSPMQPLHGQSATIQFPQAPLGNATAILNVQMSANAQHAQADGLTLGAKALLAKKMAKNGKAFNSPTDNMLTPCSAKLNQTKKKHFTKAKSVPKLFATQPTPSSTEETTTTAVTSQEDAEKEDAPTEVQEPLEANVDDALIADDVAEDKENEKPLPPTPATVEENPFLV